jgi:hypothetical protein
MKWHLSRREFLQATVGAVAVAAAGCAGRQWAADAKEGDVVAFFHISDIHVYAPMESPDHIDETSWNINARLIDQLNRLPGTQLPDNIGGGQVRQPRGVVLTGDCIDSGDKSGPEYVQAQKTEAAAFLELYGLTGADGRLKHPLYELHGNHDSPAGDGPMIDAIRQRNRGRIGLAAVSPNGLHYSWDWGPAHLLSLGVSVAPGDGRTERRRYNPLESIEFLREDLAQRVGRSGRPVIICHHLDVQRQVGKCDPALEIKAVEWDPCEMMEYYKAIRPYRVAGIFYGHTHKRDVLHWQGDKLTSDGGIALFNVANSGHYKAARLAMFYVEVSSRELVVRECFSTDRWQTVAWTPQCWRQTL